MWILNLSAKNQSILTNYQSVKRKCRDLNVTKSINRPKYTPLSIYHLLKKAKERTRFFLFLCRNYIIFKAGHIFSRLNYHFYNINMNRSKIFMTFFNREIKLIQILFTPLFNFFSLQAIPTSTMAI